MTVVATTRCLCICHAAGRSDLASQGTYHRYLDVPDEKWAKAPPPLLIDPIAAATACDSCRNAHAPALSSRSLPPRPKTPWKDVLPPGADVDEDGG